VKRSFSWGLLVPPLLALATAGGIVYRQSARHDQIMRELAGAKRDVVRLSKLLPKGEAVHETDSANCKDEEHAH
jgi:hypothetical protein